MAGGRERGESPGGLEGLGGAWRVTAVRSGRRRCLEAGASMWGTGWMGALTRAGEREAGPPGVGGGGGCGLSRFAGGAGTMGS